MQKLNISERLKALSPMPDDATLDEHPELYDQYENLLKALKKEMNAAWIKPAMKTFGYGNANGLYWSLLHLLEEQPHDDLHKALLESLATGSDGERMWAAEMLGRFAKPQDVQALVDKLNDPKELVRANIVSALGRIGDVKALPALEGAINDPSPEVQSYLKDALIALRSKKP